MSLRAVKPEAIEKRLKAFLYGAAGTGKTTFCASFPQAYFIDSEKGAENQQYIDLLVSNGSSVYQTNDFDELMKEVISLLTCKHEYKTLVIDSLTTIHNDLVDKMVLKLQIPGKTDGTEFGRHFSEANKRMKHLCNLLMRLDMNILITSHAKDEYGANLAVLGVTFDCFKKIDYMFDLVFEVQKRGSERYCVAKKSRVSSIPDGESFLFSYDEIANRYGKEILLRDAVPQELATETQLEDLILLMNQHKIPAELRQKWLDKAGSETFSEMPRDSIQKLIDYLISKQSKE